MPLLACYTGGMAEAWMVDAMWRSADLTRAYLVRDRARVAAVLAGLDDDGLDHVLTWLVLDHDALFDGFGEPFLSVREIGALAALAPVEAELAVTTAVRQVAAGTTGLARAVAMLDPVHRVHAVAISTAVILLDAQGGPAGAVAWIDNETARYKRLGHVRPYADV